MKQIRFLIEKEENIFQKVVSEFSIPCSPLSAKSELKVLPIIKPSSLAYLTLKKILVQTNFKRC